MVKHQFVELDSRVRFPLATPSPRSEMDITRRFGRRNAGSNPAEGTTYRGNN